MLKLSATAAALLALLMMPAGAQTSNPGGTPTPTAPNSGAGIPGKPGNKSGPAVKPGTTGAATESGQSAAPRLQDSSKIPGMPGNKSGPAQKPPSGSAPAK